MSIPVAVFRKFCAKAGGREKKKRDPLGVSDGLPRHLPRKRHRKFSEVRQSQAPSNRLSPRSSEGRKPRRSREAQTPDLEVDSLTLQPTEQRKPWLLLGPSLWKRPTPEVKLKAKSSVGFVHHSVTENDDGWRCSRGVFDCGPCLQSLLPKTPDHHRPW